MTICKKCLHGVVCGASDDSTLICNHFKDSSRYIELPCKVGDTVYYIEGAYYNSKMQTVRPIKVTEISWKCDRSGRDLGFALVAHGTRYKFSSIGKTVFLSREDAEKALKERSEWK